MLINKNDLFLVSEDFMNKNHTEDIDIINDIYEIILKCEGYSVIDIDNELKNKYEEWVNHTINHFKSEEDEMEETGFPMFPIHQEEHNRVLEEMKDKFSEYRNNEDLSILKEYIESIPEWLRNHIQSMDNITSNFFSTGEFNCLSH